MFKLTAIFFLMFIGSTLYAASLSCDACGRECAPACGTRHFRFCCFNYLRKKRDQASSKVWFHNLHDINAENAKQPKMPSFTIKDIPDTRYNILSNDYKPFPPNESVENHLQLVYDA